jgi:GNAT superfamily N-acetyltransferase
MSTDPELEKELAELRAERAIQRALLRYARGADRKDFELMASVYHEDAYEDHGPFQGGVRDFLEWVRRRHENIEQAMHLLGNCLIEIEGSRAFVETYCIIVQHERIGAGGLGSAPAYKRTAMGVRYIDRFEERAKQWKIAHRILVCEWMEAGLGSVGLGPGWTVAQRSREDALYRIRQPRPSAD